MVPLEKLSTAVTVANGNAKRSAVSVASVIVVPESGPGLILSNVDSCDLVTAAMVAPASTLRATVKRFIDCTWAGLLVDGVSSVGCVGDAERRSLLALKVESPVCDMNDIPKTTRVNRGGTLAALVLAHTHPWARRT